MLEKKLASAPIRLIFGSFNRSGFYMCRSPKSCNQLSADKSEADLIGEQNKGNLKPKSIFFKKKIGSGYSQLAAPKTNSAAYPIFNSVL